jgi:hypothetical protein
LRRTRRILLRGRTEGSTYAVLSTDRRRAYPTEWEFRMTRETQAAFIIVLLIALVWLIPADRNLWNRPHARVQRWALLFALAGFILLLWGKL